MNEQHMRQIGFSQITSGLARCAMAAQIIRREAAETFSDGQHAIPLTVLDRMQSHTDAHWWLLHQRPFGASRKEHWRMLFR